MPLSEVLRVGGGRLRINRLRLLPLAIASLLLVPGLAASAMVGTGLDSEEGATLQEALGPLSVESRTALSRSLDTAEAALHSRSVAGDPKLMPLLAQEMRNVQASRALIGILDRDEPDALANAVAMAKVGTGHQARSLGLKTETTVASEHGSPSAAALALLARDDVSITPTQGDELLALDSLPEGLRHALTRFLDAFLSLDIATAEAYAHADLTTLQAHADVADTLAASDPEELRKLASLGLPGDALRDAGVDFAPIFGARNALLDAVLSLRDALAATPESQTTAATPINFCPTFSIDLAGANDVYAQDCKLVLDALGNDTYSNNAGGSNLGGGTCDLLAIGAHAAAALVDLSGDDRYTSGRSCGQNGGGYVGSGFLLDGTGTDIYTAGSDGVNGGGWIGTGFLLDANGADIYTAGDNGTNGGAFAGSGFLLDGLGNDSYSSRGGVASNGGGFSGSGFLLDGLGNDGYSGGSSLTNGGGGFGAGFLLDGNGTDTYTAGSNAANGGGVAGSGFLLDGSGNDTYSAGDNGTNGGGNLGAGLLLDGGGTDSYTAGRDGVNGGAKALVSGGVTVPAFGLLFDASGADQYEDLDGGTGIDKTVVPKGSFGAQLDAPLLGKAPTVTSVSDAPDPVVAGQPITFTVRWTDTQGAVRALICKTNAITAGACAGGTWAAGAPSTTSPSTAIYETTELDVGTHTYFAFACDTTASCSGSVSGTFTVLQPNAPPTITSASDSPDPVTAGSPVTFSVGWTDNPGDLVRALICKTNAITAGACTAGTWAAGAPSTTSPSTAIYETTELEVGPQSYHAFVCDSRNQCSSSLSRTFTVDLKTPPAVPSALCQNSGGQRIVNSDLGPTHLWLYAWQESPTKSHFCVRVEGPVSLGGRVTITSASPTAPLQLATGAPTKPAECVDQIVFDPNVEIWLSETSPLADPIMLCVRAGANWNSVSFDRNWSPALTQVTWTPDPGTPP